MNDSKVKRGFSKRETVCTGVRFTCGLAFNGLGDLFATDQEGPPGSRRKSTRRMLHIEPGKHYGFPPRIRSICRRCGMNRRSSNTPRSIKHRGMCSMGVNGGPAFGPAIGRATRDLRESRRKIWRTKLAKTPLGYVAQKQ